MAEGCCFYFARPHCSAAGLVRHIPGVPNILTPKLLRKLKTSEIFGHLLWATETTEDFPGLMFNMSKHEACVCFCWSPRFKPASSGTARAVPCCCSAFARPWPRAVFHPRPLCWLWHPACPAVAEGKDPPSQSSFSQFSFQHQCPGWSHWRTALGQHSVPQGGTAQHQPSLWGWPNPPQLWSL